MSADPMDARRCSAKSKRSGERCKRAPVIGATVCAMHGGLAPQVKAAAEARQTEAAAGAVVAKLVWRSDAAPVTNAVGALQLLAGQLQHAADVLGSELEASDLDPVRATAWLRVLRELRTALSEMERLGIAERHAELEAEKVRVVASALGVVFEALGLTVEQRATGTRLLLAELRAAEVVPGEVTA